MWFQELDHSEKQFQNEIKNGNIPKHIAIIMDGNGRWAKKQLLPRLNGHRKGIETVKDVVKASSQIGVRYLTLYAFSIENWKRPKAEVNGLMNLLEKFLLEEIDELDENKVKLTTIGKINSLPKNIQKILKDCMERTKNNDGLVLNLALSYGSRWDITRAIQLISMDVRRGKLSPEDINEETISSYLQTVDIPDPDLLIRTSGEYRISNFLLWELAYSEIHIEDKLWPDFTRKEFYDAIFNFQKRERRFGKTSEQLEEENDSLFQKAKNVFKKN